MTFNPDLHHRHSIRLLNYDYAQAGAYFVTVCTWQRGCLFGEIVNGEMVLNEFGRVVDTVYCRLIEHFTNINLDEYSIMPNHFHAIILIQDNVGAKQDSPALPAFDHRGTRAKHDNTVLSPLHGTMPGSIGSIIQNFKSVTTRKINQIRTNPGCPVWQRNYYERVIRNEHELTRAREYIVNNPLKWELDRENPVNTHTNTGT
ncbi:MAG TPA: hypothetical protein HPP97_13470 [Desulfuromonadales bacterium]|nr:hypothetical protein [Desulfuromonadales bacterium]